MRAADAGFEHASAPHRNAISLCCVVDGDSLAESANAADFDVDDAAGAVLNRSLRIASAANGFIETDCGLKLLLEVGVKVEIVIP